MIQDAKAKMAFDAPVKAVENLMLQYNETDWQFVKRLASHSNSVLIPAADSLTMTCRDNSVKLESGGSGILLDSGKAIKVTGNDKVDITSKSDITASSSKDLKVSANQKLALSGDSAIEASSKGSSIKVDGDINMKAKLIKEN